MVIDKIYHWRGRATCLKELGVTNLYRFEYPVSKLLPWSTVPRVSHHASSWTVIYLASSFNVYWSGQKGYSIISLLLLYLMCVGAYCFMHILLAAVNGVTRRLGFNFKQWIKELIWEEVEEYLVVFAFLLTRGNRGSGRGWVGSPCYPHPNCQFLEIWKVPPMQRKIRLTN